MNYMEYVQVRMNYLQVLLEGYVPKSNQRLTFGNLTREFAKSGAPTIVKLLFQLNYTRNSVVKEGAAFDKISFDRDYAAVLNFLKERPLANGPIWGFGIQNVATGMFLAASDDFKACHLEQLEGFNSPTMHWHFRQIDQKCWILVSAYSGRCLDVSRMSQEPGAEVSLWEQTKTPNQLWQLHRQSEDDSYIIQAEHSEMVLDVSDSSTQRTGCFVQYHWNGGENQRWRIRFNAP